MQTRKAIELCLDHITGQFETGGKWDRVTDNFDGFGPSIGIVQFAWGIGSLQTVLNTFKRDAWFGDYMDKDKAEELILILERPLFEQKKHALEKWFDGKAWKDLKMKEGFETLAKSAAFRRAQIEGVAYYEEIALNLFKASGLNTVRAFCVFFDIAIQNGGVKKEIREEIFKLISEKELELCKCLSEKEKLKIWIDVRVSKANPLWQKDVLARKTAILEGEGVVHGKRYSFAFLNLDENLETT